MTSVPDDMLPLAQQIALNYAASRDRDVYAALFAFDQRLSELVGKASEPLLGQMRLAWWRDELRKPVGDRTRGDPVLDALGDAWGAESEALIALVDGWEHLFAEPPLPDQSALDFAEGRAASFAAIARLLGQSDHAEAALASGRLWALLDLAAGVSRDDEREAALRLARRVKEPSYLPRRMRPLAILAGLARRARRRGGGALVDGRGDVLAAMRIGMLGR